MGQAENGAFTATSMNLDAKYPVKERHQAFVDHGEGVLVCLAGPGTGKTYSLGLRVQSLVDDKRVEPAQVCYISFVGEIVDAFRQDLGRYYEKMGRLAPDIPARTLHGLACRLIRNQGYRLGLQDQWEFLNFAEERDWAARVALEDLFLLVRSRTAPSVAKLRGVFREDMKAAWQAGRSVNEVDGMLEPYRRLSRSFRMMDWDEVIPLATQIYDICDSLDAIPPWLATLKHLLIDEYQDFNPAEQSFLNRLIQRSKSAVIVGDDDQSLYSSRGAEPSGIVGLSQDPRVDSVSLVLSRRCPSAMTAAANRFLGQMKEQPRELKPLRQGGSVAIHRFKSAKAEAAFLVDYLVAAHSCLGPTAETEQRVACLFPWRNVLNQYSKVLAAAGVPCEVRSRVENSDAERWVRTVLRLAFQRGQPFLQRLLLTYYPEIMPRHHKALVLRVMADGATMTEAVTSLVQEGMWTGPAAEAATDFLALLGEVESRHPGRVASAIERFVPAATACDPEVVEEFFGIADSAGVEEAVDVTTRRLLGTPQEQPATMPPVDLLTMHGAKGLNRERVVLPGLEQSWLPGTAKPRDLPERMRLFYVAITRASCEVLITCPWMRAKGDSLNYAAPGRGELSRFARALGVQAVWH